VITVITGTSAIILAAGAGSKMLPYSAIRSKTTIKIAGIPLIRYNIETLAEAGCSDIVVVTSSLYERELKASLYPLNIKLICSDGNSGSADSLIAGASLCSNENIIALYGDTIVDSQDINRLYHADGIAALLYPIRDDSRNWIGASVLNNEITEIGAHYRGNSITHQFAGFKLDNNAISQIENTPDYFPNVKVGVGVPRERFVEAGLIKLVRDKQVRAVIGEAVFFDIDKPWHMLAANEYMVKHRTKRLTQNVLMEGARISQKAMVKGFVQLGKNSYIGDNVLICGNAIIGDNTVIDNGAILNGYAVIGGNTVIRNYCQIYDGVSVGSGCIMDHCAELTGGMLMDRVYLYHYCEIYGAIGSYCDIGAATVCGALRFDDGVTRQVVKGRGELPLDYGNAVYIGDYCRTGVNAILMPGCKVGAYSIIGPGVILDRDIEEHSLVQVEQQLNIKRWSHDKYGW
jgi:bifunctional UDP-N-acetylglucosamine pyrophosphorylase/glucosamine-1-phosphate N-acetyltransferase